MRKELRQYLRAQIDRKVRDTEDAPELVECSGTGSPSEVVAAPTEKERRWIERLDPETRERLLDALAALG